VQLGGYLSTWSAVGRYRAVTGADPVPDVMCALAARWGSVAAERRHPLAADVRGRIASLSEMGSAGVMATCKKSCRLPETRGWAIWPIRPNRSGGIPEAMIGAV
jgi:hypothetical protein